MMIRRWLTVLSVGVVLPCWGVLLNCLGREPGDPAPQPGLPRASAGDWPWWRGPSLDGMSADPQALTSWSPTKNVLWKTKVPGRGHASPIVWGGRVFLNTAEEEVQRQLVLAFDRKTGKKLWSAVAGEGGFPRKYGKNSHASATPACDGERVYSVFVNHNALQVTATDLNGKIVWQKTAGAFQSEHGYGSSPLLYQSLVIVNGDNLKGSFLAALDARTGKVVWHTERRTTGRHGSYGTPILAQLASKPQLILGGMSETASYDPATGKLLWSCTGPAEVTGNTMAWSDTLVFSSGGFPEKEILALRADGAGDVTQSHVLWRSSKGVTYVPSPLYHDGSLYIVNDQGVVTCFDAATGKQVWQDRLQGAFSSSPVLVGDRLYATNEAGTTFIFKAGPRFELVATNSIGEGVMATPAICGGQIYLRTSGYLYCLGSSPAVKE